MEDHRFLTGHPGLSAIVVVTTNKANGELKVEATSGHEHDTGEESEWICENGVVAIRPVNALGKVAEGSWLRRVLFLLAENHGPMQLRIRMVSNENLYQFGQTRESKHATNGFVPKGEELVVLWVLKPKQAENKPDEDGREAPDGTLEQLRGVADVENAENGKRKAHDNVLAGAHEPHVRLHYV